MFQIKSNHYGVTIGEHVFLRMQLLDYSGEPITYDLTLENTTIHLRIQRSPQDSEPIIDDDMTLDPYEDQVVVYEIEESVSEDFEPGMYMGQITLEVQAGEDQQEEIVKSWVFPFRVYEGLVDL